MENEALVLQQLNVMVHQRLATYSTSLEQDVEMLKDIQAFPYGSNQRNARNVLKDEKALLRYLIEFSELMVEWLKLDLDDLEDAMDQRYTDPDLAEAEWPYAEHVIKCLVEKHHNGYGEC